MVMGKVNVNKNEALFSQLSGTTMTNNMQIYENSGYQIYQCFFLPIDKNSGLQFRFSLK